MDFLSDQLIDGSKIRVLTIVDAFSRLSPAIDVRQHSGSRDVVDTLERVTVIYGLPKSIRVDQRQEQARTGQRQEDRPGHSQSHQAEEWEPVPWPKTTKFG